MVLVQVKVISCPTTRNFAVRSLFSRIRGIFKSRVFLIIFLFFATSFLAVKRGYVHLGKLSCQKTRQSLDENPIKIVIWISPQTERFSLHSPEYRRNVTRTMIVEPQNMENSCFHQHRCEISMDEETLREADAILFFMFNVNFYMGDLPPYWETWRKPNQVWIIHADEAPVNVNDMGVLPPVFDWSMTYRTDSKVWWPYGRKEPLIPEIPSNQELQINGNVPLSAWISGKTKLVATVISHCNVFSNRKYLMELLQNTGKQVDVYGKCGNLSANCNFYQGNCTHFWHKLAKTYKFYLAFENAICVDYVTEKFWRTLELGMVPVVYGGANYTQLAPPGSFIDVNQFESADSLMSFLEEVGGNATLYATYFDWRRNHKLGDSVQGYFGGNNKAWCELCLKLHAFKNAGGNSLTQIPSQWWSKMPNNPSAPACIPPHEFTIGKWESFGKQYKK